MVPGMIPYSVSRFAHHPNKIGMVLRGFADHKKCGLRLKSLQQSKHKWCGLRIRSVVECQSDSGFISDDTRDASNKPTQKT